MGFVQGTARDSIFDPLPDERTGAMGVTARLLLDTHALLWTLLEPERIPKATPDQIRDPGTELFGSQRMAPYSAC